MKRAKRNGHRPGRGTKGANNPMLKPEDQGKSYIVKLFLVQPEVTILDAEGVEEMKYMGPQIAIFQKQLSDPLPKFMADRGFKLESGK